MSASGQALRRQEQRFDTTLVVRLEHGEGIVRNVSANGIYFVTDVALEEGATLKFTLEFRDLPGGPLQAICDARVVRVERREAKKGVAATISSFEFRRVSRSEPPS